MKIKKKHINEAKELAKDIGLFITGLLIGPVVDVVQLTHKHYYKIKELTKNERRTNRRE